MVERRAPDLVMQLPRLGALHQSRLSFMRQLTRRLAREDWQFSRSVFNIDKNGVGHAVYEAKSPEHTYSLVAFSHDLPPEKRSDRVIADAWDATFALFDGKPTHEDIKRLSENVPLQEAGRVSANELSLSRANRSVRLWDHVVNSLAQGKQPAGQEVDKVGYLMRTTAVYGSGKFGAADRDKIAGRAEMQAPFQAEMLSVYLTRWFVRDLVEHMARMKGGDGAVVLERDIAQRLGIGNSTGLGMAPYIINHPMLFNNWITAREEAIARVRNVEKASGQETGKFRTLFESAKQLVTDWRSDHPIQVEKLADLKRDLEHLNTYLTDHSLEENNPWDSLMLWAGEALSNEGQELVASLILEPYGHLVDDLGKTMADGDTDAFVIDGAMSVAQVSELIEKCFNWAFDLDWQAKENCTQAWYVSEEKLEPRLGNRFEEPVADYEQPLAPARDASAAYQALKAWDPDEAISTFLTAHPEHRHTVRRAQISAKAPYGEIRSNTIAADVVPIDMLRAKLSFFGATHFDPRSDRWVRICMYAGAPYPDDLTRSNSDLWVYPEVVS